MLPACIHFENSLLISSIEDKTIPLIYQTSCNCSTRIKMEVYSTGLHFTYKTNVKLQKKNIIF